MNRPTIVGAFVGTLVGTLGRGTRHAAVPPVTAVALALVLAVVLALAGCSTGDGAGQGQDAAADQQSAPAAGQSSPTPEDAAASGLIPDLVQRIEPSVVAVATDGGEGSGVVWDDAGLIVTNNHVIADARQIEVVFQNQERVAAQVRATDPRSDLAVLETGREGLSPASFAEATPRVGDLAVAIGNPLGFENSVTAGIVSGLDRTVPDTALTGLIQTDAAISPGNSGGALVGADGQIIGINVAYIPPQQTGAVSIGFAIPSVRVVDVVEQLLEDGAVEHAFLGVGRLETVTPALAQQFGLPVDHGALVTEVVPGTPAAGALQPGDIIVEAGGEEIRGGDDLVAAITRRSPGDDLDLRFFRDGSEQSATVPLADRPS